MPAHLRCVGISGNAGRILIRLADLVRLARGGAVGLLVLSVARSALSFPSSRLVYVRGPGAGACPDQSSVREAVRKRLGYDPFFPSSDKTIILRVMRDSGKLRGEVELVDEQGKQVGKREFSAAQDECDQLLRAMALSISIAIDPKSAETYAQGPDVDGAPDPPIKQTEPQTDSQPEPLSPALLTPPAPATAPKAKPSREAAPRLWSAGLGATLQLGSMPQAALGATAFGALRTGSWSLAIEGELDAPVTTEQQGVELRSSGGGLKLLPCGHWRLLSACPVSALRWLTATGSASGLGATAGSLAFGARLGFELPLSPSFSALASGDLLLTAVPVRLVSEGRDLWETPLFSGGFAIAAAMHF
jgi:hypothetical protein